MRARRWLQVLAIAAVAAGACALAFVALPLPRACDARRDEIPEARYAELARFSGTLTRAQLAQALRHADPDGRLAPYYTLDDAALEIRPYAAAAAAVRVTLRPPGAAAGPGAAPPPPRAYHRIAIDPGHHGGAWSRAENRHFQPAGRPAVREGDLAWATARLVEQGLRAAGTDVQVVRGPPPPAPYPAGADPGFDAALEAAFRLSEQQPRELRAPPLGLPWLTPLQALALARRRSRLMEETPFELYVRYDLRRRTEAAAAFAADLTLSLHWNHSENGRNGVLVFVPGHSVGGDLASASQRFWAFRRALDGTFTETLRLARLLARALARHLDLPAMDAGDFSEARANWRALDPALGVFARDVAIPRRAPGVAMVLEGPCVNHPAEYRRLLGEDIEVDGRRYPARVRQYADAVLEGLAAAGAEVQSRP
jgi:N-acetylmuramoyl-L-alanine amidase